MFGRQALAAIGMMVGIVIGIIIAVNDSWQKGVTVGAIIFGLAFIFAGANMYFGTRNWFR